MISVTSLTFNPFQENTYVLAGPSKEAWIIDPGCHNSTEEEALVKAIEDDGLKVKAIINTHCHIDHVLGNKAMVDFFQAPLIVPKGEVSMLKNASSQGALFGVVCQPSPSPDSFLIGGESLILGDTEFSLISAPGHSPDSICLYCPSSGFLIGGDVLFRNSIGRTDLPGGDYNTLIHNIQTKIYTLPEDTVVYPGHGPETTVGYEKKSNPFVTA